MDYFVTWLYPQFVFDVLGHIFSKTPIIGYNEKIRLVLAFNKFQLSTKSKAQHLFTVCRSNACTSIGILQYSHGISID